MPELPEIQVFSQNLTKLFKGSKLKKLVVKDGRRLLHSEEEFNKRLQGKKLIEVYRSGKELRFKFEKGEVLGMHVMLTGDIIHIDETNARKTTVVELHFDNGKAIALTDFLKQAKVFLDPDDKGGVDALSEDLTYEYLKKVLNKKKPIKTLLMDQNIIRGIGGAYSDEILWEIKVHPFSIGSAIPDEKIRELPQAIRNVLTNVTNLIYENKPGIISGDVRDFSKIHDKNKTHCPNGKPILMEEMGGRKNYFTEEQVLYK
jgi:formamidopyrimidine-DNA glycosylase